MPRREEFLPYAIPSLDGSELAAIKEVLDSGWLTTGPKTVQFEQAFAAAVGAKHAIAVTSATAAMHLALEAIGLRPGDEVITTPYTFAATAEVIRYFNAHPVFVDVEPDSLQMQPDLVRQAITHKTRAILPVHLAGLPAELECIYSLAVKHNLVVVEDAAHAFPARYKDQTIGSPSGSNPTVLTCFSFYATKTITTGEGGMITTSDDRLAERCRIMALHGIDRNAWKRQEHIAAWQYQIIAPGYKYNMTDIAAAIGLAQLAKAEQMWLRRYEIAQSYNSAFQQAPELQRPHNRSDCQHAWQLYMLRLNLERLTIDRADFIEQLRQRNIGTSVHFAPLHLHPYYRETYGFKPEDFPVARQEYLREISLPIYSKMTNGDVQDVINAVLETVDAYRR